MNGHTILAAALTAALIPVAASASPGAVRGVILFLAVDRNSDAAVDRSEADGFRSVIFDAIDSNKDGRVTPQEVGILLVPAKADASKKEQDKIAKKREQLLTKLDLAKPEGVAKDEYIDRNAELFAKADANKDGKVSEAEFSVIIDAYGVLLPR
jgi:Ca2+-binding EF-hand superfamily protein